MFNYLLWRWKCSCTKWRSLCAMQCINFVTYILQPACSVTYALSAGWFTSGSCRFMRNRKKTSSSSPSALDSPFLSVASTTHVFLEQCCRLFLSSCTAFQRQTERKSLGDSESLGLVLTTSMEGIQWCVSLPADIWETSAPDLGSTSDLYYSLASRNSPQFSPKSQLNFWSVSFLQPVWNPFSENYSCLRLRSWFWKR